MLSDRAPRGVRRGRRRLRDGRERRSRARVFHRRRVRFLRVQPPPVSGARGRSGTTRGTCGGRRGGGHVAPRRRGAPRRARRPPAPDVDPPAARVVPRAGRETTAVPRRRGRRCAGAARGTRARCAYGWWTRTVSGRARPEHRVRDAGREPPQLQALEFKFTVAHDCASEPSGLGGGSTAEGAFRLDVPDALVREHRASGAARVRSAARGRRDGRGAPTGTNSPLELGNGGAALETSRACRRHRRRRCRRPEGARRSGRRSRARAPSRRRRRRAATSAAPPPLGALRDRRLRHLYTDRSCATRPRRFLTARGGDGRRDARARRLARRPLHLFQKRCRDPRDACKEKQ